jgi:sn-glycerol 3-phosphate transport system permease protein
MGVGFNFLLFLVALRGMPRSLIEAPTMYCAGALTRQQRIKQPQLTPTIFYVALTNMVLALMTSGPVMIITQGGPARATTTLVYLMYTSGYGSSNYSLAACVSLITFAFAFAMTLLAFAFERKGVHYGD